MMAERVATDLRSYSFECKGPFASSPEPYPQITPDMQRLWVAFGGCLRKYSGLRRSGCGPDSKRASSDPSIAAAPRPHSPSARNCTPYFRNRTLSIHRAFLRRSRRELAGDLGARTSTPWTAPTTSRFRAASIARRRRFTALPVVPVQPAQVKLHLARVGRFKVADLQLDRDQASHVPVKEEQVDIVVVAVEGDSLLPLHEGKSCPEFEEEVLDLPQNRRFEILLAIGIRKLEEVEHVGIPEHERRREFVLLAERRKLFADEFLRFFRERRALIKASRPSSDGAPGYSNPRCGTSRRRSLA